MKALADIQIPSEIAEHAQSLTKNQSNKREWLVIHTVIFFSGSFILVPLSVFFPPFFIFVFALFVYYIVALFTTLGSIQKTSKNNQVLRATLVHNNFQQTTIDSKKRGAVYTQGTNWTYDVDFVMTAKMDFGEVNVVQRRGETSGYRVQNMQTDIVIDQRVLDPARYFYHTLVIFDSQQLGGHVFVGQKVPYSIGKLKSIDSQKVVEGYSLARPSIYTVNREESLKLFNKEFMSVFNSLPRKCNIELVDQSIIMYFLFEANAYVINENDIAQIFASADALRNELMRQLAKMPELLSNKPNYMND